MTQPLATNDRAALVNALAGESIVDASRLIAINALSAESAARRGDMPLAFAKLRLVADALNEAREIVAIAGRIAK